MKKIAITGGKGGTGKSTIAVLMALDFIKKGKKVFLVDCDVECPNDFLLTGQKLKNSLEKVYADFPKLNKDKCRKCGLCVKTCRENAIFQKPGDYPIFMKELCSACGACRIVCPRKAIEVGREQVGEIFVNEINNKLWLITGMARTRLEETGPVVNKLKKLTFDLSKKENPDIVLFDTAAGTHCPVITALLGCDLAYAVTEPTSMGAYDLELILDLCDKLKISVRVILNQADLGNKEKIHSVINKRKVKIEKEVLYSKKILELYSKGQLLNFKE
ncbi:MAG: P-loop NTPase [Candidatus Portnoybacteria bacterium]|nr:P-loop NTPase [Candidatus Portnoybacteria bacterium]